MILFSFAFAEKYRSLPHNNELVEEKFKCKQHLLFLYNYVNCNQNGGFLITECGNKASKDHRRMDTKCMEQ